MEELLKTLNKKALAENTNISYSRIRNLASGVVAPTKEELYIIKQYINNLLKNEILL